MWVQKEKTKLYKLRDNNNPMGVLFKFVLVCTLATVEAVKGGGPFAGREKVNFDFGWRHKLGMVNAGFVCPKMIPGKNIGEGGYLTKNVDSPSACCELCSLDHGGCWDYNLDTGDCWVKTDCKSETANSRRITGSITALPGPAQESFDDFAWELVDAPHDMLIVQKFEQNASKKQGFIPRSSGWYRKHFYLPKDWDGSTIWWRCEGSFHKTFVYFNGVFMKVHKAGYTSFSVRLDNHSAVRYGQGSPNVLALFVDASSGTGWWYEGGGLMRHNYIMKANQAHITEDTAWVSAAPKLDGSKESVFTVKSQVSSPGETEGLEEGALTLSVTVTDPDGQRAGSSSAAVIPGKEIAMDIVVGNTQLWSVQTPKLYTVSFHLLSETGASLDTLNISTGSRRVQFSPSVGLRINDERVKLRGFCDHSSFAIVGGAVPDRINLFRAQTLRSVGGNSWRMAHNPPIPIRLDFMDALGMLAVDENRDYGGRTGQGGNTEESINDEINDMADLVKRDRSHPSVIIWSFCNEVGCNNGSSAKPFREVSKRYDPTRDVTQNHLGKNVSTFYLDVQGFSHKKSVVFHEFHKQNPNKPMLATECCSCMSQRGIDKDVCPEPEDGGCGGRPGPIFYNNEIGKCTADQVIMSDLPDFMAGTFVWSGFDYLGESRGWPQNIKCRGTISDATGFRKESAYWFRSWWLSNISRTDAGRPCHVDDGRAAYTIFIVDSWVPPPHGNFPRNITVYTNAPSVRMLLNGKFVSRASVPYFGLASFEIPYVPGNLTAIAEDPNGKEVARFSKHTPGECVKIRLSVNIPSEATGTGSKVVLDGEDVAMLKAELLDANDNLVNSDTRNISFAVVSGPGKLWGTHNGNPANLSPNHSPWTLAYGGLASAIVRTTVDAASAASHRERLLQTTPLSERTVKVVNPNQAYSAEKIVVRAVADGIALPAEVGIITSVDAENNLPLAIAKKMTRL